MTHLHFTLKTEEIQKSIQDDEYFNDSFNQLMEEQRTQYLQANDYERSNQRVSQ